MATPALRSVAELLHYRIGATPDKNAYAVPDGSGWKKITWKQFGERVRELSMGLRKLGLKDEERCAIMSGTRYDWICADMGILCAGGATTTVYPSNTEEDTAYILNDSGTRFVFAETEDHLKKLLKRRGEMPKVEKVITFDGKKSDDGWIITLNDLAELGRGAPASEWEAIGKAVKTDAIATLIYTSGTTGKPKGVVLTHDCWLYEGEGIESLGILTPDDIQYLWLPLAHSFGKVLEVAQLRIGFETAVDGRVDKLVENLGVVKPTFVAAVPRIFEKVYNKVIADAKAAGGAKLAIFKWALEVGREVSALKQQQKEPGGFLALKNALATKLVFSKLKTRFGGQLRYFVSGSAPLSREMAEFFHAFGFLVLEGYGLTETSAATFVNRPNSFQFGTVGPPMPGTELKIAEDGEILIKGRGVMRGYHNLPQQTEETIKDGWLHSGDIGELTSLGNLRITDRKKDLIKTSGGKYVAPQMIESKIKLMSGLIGNVVVHGNNRNFCVALLALEPDAVTAWARTNNVPGTYAEIVKDQRLHQFFEPLFKDMNKTLANYEQVKKFAILPQDLTEKDGDLTPSLKVKRKAVEAKYKELLDGFYAGSVGDV